MRRKRRREAGHGNIIFNVFPPSLAPTHTHTRTEPMSVSSLMKRTRRGMKVNVKWNVSQLVCRDTVYGLWEHHVT